MTRLLFRPFDLRTWLVVGFSAFLAELGSRGGSGGSGVGRRDLDLDEIGEGGTAAWQQIVEGGLWVALAAFGCLVVFALVLAVVWISSRGKFVFLDNVVHGRAHIVEPWKRLRHQGNSLFVYQVVFFLSCVVLFGLLIGGLAATVGLASLDEIEASAALLPTLAGAVTLLALILAIFYAVFFVDAFVAPLMHRYDLGILDGWRRFLDIFREQSWPFLLCGLGVFVVAIALGVLVLVFGILTCCLGFLLLMIPYVSSVIVLPFSVFYRSFTVEFLAQFDPDLLPERGAARTAPEPATA